MNFTWEALRGAQNSLEHLQNQIRELGDKNGVISDEFKNKFLKVINDDLNTTQALAVVQELLKSDIAKENKLATILDFNKVLGLRFEDIKQILRISVGDKLLIDERAKARLEKNWTESDRLRAEIEKLGYIVEDTTSGQRIFKK